MTDARPRNILIYLCLALVTAAVYWPVRNFQFINYDDAPYVTNNPHVQRGLTREGVVWAFTNHDGNWHPLTWLSHMMDCELFGLQPGAHHLVSGLFHIVSTLLLFTIFNRMTGAPWRSGLVAALFALHPLHVESVAWVAERKDVLSAMFWMLTIWAYIRYVEEAMVHGSGVEAAHAHPGGSRPGSPIAHRPSPIVFYVLALFFFVLGLMSKPMVVTLPFVLLLLDYWPLGRMTWARGRDALNDVAAGDRGPTNDMAGTQPSPTNDVAAGDRSPTNDVAGTQPGPTAALPISRLLLEKLPFLALAAASSAATFVAQRSGGSVVPLGILPGGARVANAVVSCVRYLAKAFWPDGLAVFYPYQGWTLWAVIGCATILGVVTCAVLWRARREPYFMVGWLWYLGMLLPVIGLVQVGGISMADRYTYLPLVGVFVMVAWSVPDRLVHGRLPKTIAVGVATVLLGVSAALCRLQLGYWQTSETLFRHALGVTKGNWLAHFNLAVALSDSGRFQDAIGHYQEALRLWPDYALGHNELGIALAQTDRIPEAVEEFQLAVRLNPDFADGHSNLALALVRLGRPKEAIAEWEQALRLSPDDAETHYNLGVTLEQSGNIKDAIAHYEQAVRIKPDFVEAKNRLSLLQK